MLDFCRYILGLKEAAQRWYQRVVTKMDRPDSETYNHPSAGQLPPRAPIDLQRLGGSTTACGATIEQRIVELVREKGRREQEINYYRSLVYKVLMPLIPVLELHVRGLRSVLRKFKVKIEDANGQWEAEQENSVMT